jgi:ribA/ribD-fused uncharacterized protein
MREKITYFYGKYSFLSNFYQKDFLFTVDWSELKFKAKSAEHAYQASKTTNINQFVSILNCYSPGKAKSKGRNIVLRSDWENIKIDVMYKILQFKFKDEFLRKLLLDTDDLILEEGNYWNDTFWGICRGVGQNNLGILLMKLRNEIRNNLK